MNLPIVFYKLRWRVLRLLRIVPRFTGFEVRMLTDEESLLVVEDVKITDVSEDGNSITVTRWE